jgi:(p)ppGpp synthase/HD superfamily hydrolase
VEQDYWVKDLSTNTEMDMWIEHRQAVIVTLLNHHETIDKMTDRQIAAKVRQHFRGLKQISSGVDGIHAGKAGDEEMEYRRGMLWERALEDLDFLYLEPEKYREIAMQIDECWSDREHYIARIKAYIQEMFAREGLKAEITGRPKRVYSIYCKMQRTGLPFSQINDICAIRVVVATVPHCYQVLDIMHSIFHVIPGEFDDYIVTPKGNLYRSLHTTVFDNEGKTLEVQIRTRDMNEESEYGASAHWRYKEEHRRSDLLRPMRGF